MEHTQERISEVPSGAEIAADVTAQHGMIKAAFHAAKTGSAQERQKATRQLLQLLAMHEAAEQLSVHPALAKAGGGEVGIGEDRTAEEEQAVQLAERLQGFEPDSYEYDLQFALLEEAVTHHATAEELSELPLFEDLTATQRLGISQAVGAVRRAAADGDLVSYDTFSAMIRQATSWLGR